MTPLSISRSRSALRLSFIIRKRLSGTTEHVSPPKISFRKSFPDNFKKFMNYAKPAKKTLILGILCLPGALIPMMTVPLVVGKVIDLVSTSLASDRTLKTSSLLEAKKLGVALICLSLLGSVATFGRSYFINLSSERIVNSLRSNLFKTLLQTKQIKYFDKNKTGDLISRIASDTTLIASFLSESISMGLRGVTTLTFGFGFLIYTSPLLASISFCSLLPLITFARFYGSRMKKQTNEQLEKFGSSTSIVEESLSLIKPVHVFNSQNKQIKKYNDELNQVFELGKALCLTRGKFFGITQLIMDMTMISLIGSGSYLVFNDILTPGELTTFLMYSVYVAGANFQITSFYSAAMKALGANQRLEVIQNTSSVDDKLVNHEESKKIKLFENGKDESYGIELENVNFSYPSRENEIILKDFSLSLPKNKIIGIIGSSGCGKSTLFSLILNLYSLNTGNIFFKKQDNTKYKLNDIDIKNLRQNIGLVTQDSFILQDTIYNNLIYGLSEKETEQMEGKEKIMERIEKLSKLCDIDEFIKTLPEGYETIIGERGSELSGGQKQKLSLVRVLLKKPKILLLDEFTSSLDIKSENKILTNLTSYLKSLKGEREKSESEVTTIIITHRLNILNNVDYIVVMNEGKVIEYDKKNIIIQNKNGLFYEYLKNK